MTAPSVNEFYAPSHRGTPYGVVDALHAKGHSGADFNGWAAGTRIPAFAAGTVAAKGNSKTNFGYWVSVDIGGGYFAHYCHEQSANGGPAVGSSVAVGTDMGPLGSTGYSTGNHLHAMVSRASNPDRYFGVTDPMPWINAALGGGGAGGFTPSQGDEMRLIRHPNGTITTVGETTYQHHSLESYQADTATLGPYVQVDEATFNRIISNTQVRLAYLKAGIGGSGGGGSVDVAAIAAKVEATLADDFKRLADQIATVNANIDDQPTEFKISPA